MILGYFMVNKNKNINYIIHGQSNAAGNVMPTEIDSGLKPFIENCNILNLESNNSETLKVGVNNYGVPSEYFDFFQATYSNGFRYGIEIELSKLLKEYYNSTINIFKYTWPGSSLGSLGQGGDWKFTTGNLMPKVATQYTKYKSKLKINQNEDFLIWIQGESNVGNEVTYKTNIKNWIDSYRVQLGFNIPLIIVSLSTQQNFLNAGQVANFKTMQNTLGSWVFDNTNETFTSQTGFIDNCFVLSQNEPCQNESGVFIHYSKIGITNISKGIFQIIKSKIII
jgi:hypothetical protein